ncbi:hypothetical protein N6H18_14490 [Reichenbachiella agarivorans]|uniref:DUF4142 domain-containing protein n=1 Tax=Reichenbachiella agarivorans TaxID=2979464 RepID=A0ABY6CM61_9BACT|nr:hypothetical protein [Reichenbachiella agarivorans]UXP31557.1 hypothetical protein N6H18_14490 [Reichenbachiella agarivorans]
MKRTILVAAICAISTAAFSQSSTSIVTTIDSLTQVWDKEAVVIESYEGMRDYCTNRVHRQNTIDMIKLIHHYDSALYKTVKSKYDINQDAEAKATLDDIKKLETEYTTKEFLSFIHEECATFNMIEKNYGKSKGKTYEKEVKKMEKELAQYVDQITLQIDIIDEHIHHLEGLD